MQVLVIGESLVDVVHRPGREALAVAGGSPMNVAVGLCRLGIPAVLQSRFGTDDAGSLIQDHLSANGVVVTYGTRQAVRTSSATATIGEDGAATYDFDVEWDTVPATEELPDLAAVHTGSIAAVLEPGATVVEEQLGRLRDTATVSFDPNVRPELMGDPASARSRIARFVALADVVKASSEDIAWLHPDEEPESVAQQWLETGPAVVLVTFGSEGAFAVARSGIVRAPATPVAVADTIGAGDSFMAGTLAALADHDLLGRAKDQALQNISVETLQQILAFAVRCAAITVSRVGADPPTRADL